ncbi:MAG: hypothetical protein J0651_03550 [Actinobacteria bacterium]|nr:hypothetical protein [Actinomycetota bacterium]
MDPTMRTLHHRCMPSQTPLHPLTDIKIDDIPLRTQVLLDMEFILRFTSTQRATTCIYPIAPSQSHIQFIQKIFPFVEFYAYSANMLSPLDVEYDPDSPQVTANPGPHKIDNLTITSLPFLTSDAVQFSRRSPARDLVMISRHHDIQQQTDLHKLTCADYSFLAISLMHAQTTLQGEFIIPIHTHASESFIYQVVRRGSFPWFYDFFQVRSELSYFHSAIRNQPQQNYDKETENLVFHCYSQKFGFTPLPVLMQEFNQSFPVSSNSKEIEDAQMRQILDVLRVLQDTPCLPVIPE